MTVGGCATCQPSPPCAPPLQAVAGGRRFKPEVWANPALSSNGGCNHIFSNLIFTKSWQLPLMLQYHHLVSFVEGQERTGVKSAASPPIHKD